MAKEELRKEAEEKDLADYQFNYSTIKELQKENAELKEINAHTISQLNLDNGELIIENEKLKKENAALRQDFEIMKNTISEYNDFCDKYMNLEKENRELKDNFKIAKDNEYEYQSLFIKAKELLKRFIELDVLDCYDIVEEAEQFLNSEVEK